jgi:hypothetical protein
MRKLSPKTIAQFAMACEGLSNDDIYDLFYDECDQELRDEILCTFWSHNRVQETVRSAMRQVGARYGVTALLNY